MAKDHGSSSTDDTQDEDPRDKDDGIGAEDEGSATADKPPAAPDSDDDSPLGDTDQHSSADA
jgi:hypothetical protein